MDDSAATAAPSFADDEGSVFRLLELIGESVWRRNLHTNHVTITAGIWAALGYSAADVPKSLDEILAIFETEDAHRVLAELGEYLAHETGAYVTTARVRSRAGDRRWLRFSGVIVERGKHGDPLVVGGLVSDVTQQVEQDQRRISAEEKLRTLSKREKQILECIIHGLTSKEIALKLGLSPRTIDFYRPKLMKKLEVSGVAGMIKLASIAQWNFPDP